MTRINVVPAKELSRQHLVAEYREIGRIYKLVRKAVERGEDSLDKQNPGSYTLGTGHVRFFYPRLQFIRWRQIELYNEMRERGYKPSFKPPSVLDIIGWTGIDESWYQDYVPTPEAIEINRARIMERS